MNLSELQKDFIEGIFNGKDANAASHVIGDEILTAEQRFGIYRGSVHGILTQALGLTFPVCKSLVGEKFFDKMCGVFIDQYPPTTSFFAEYGNHFAKFLSRFEHLQHIPYISDIACLEWARHEVWHKVRNQPFDFGKLAELDESDQANVSFILSDTLRLIQSNYRIDEIWFAHQEDSDAKLELIELDIPVKLLIWKDSEVLKISLMHTNKQDSLFWDFLLAISKETKVSDLAVQFGEDLPILLNQGIESTWIQSFVEKPTETNRIHIGEDV